METDELTPVAWRRRAQPYLSEIADSDPGGLV